MDEVYKETQERIRQVGLKEDGSKPDPRDLAMLTALSVMKKRSGGDKAVEQVTLLEEIEKVQASSEFKNAMEKDSADELVSKVFYGALNTLDGYARPAPTGPVAEAQAKL